MTGATTAAVRREPPSPSRIPGEPGAWIFIVGEMVIFSALFGVIAFYHGRYGELFVGGEHALKQWLGLTNTIVLLTGSIVVVLATVAVSSRRYDVAASLATAAIGCGLLFCGIKAIEYLSLLHHRISIHTNQFWMLFFVITGAHLVHVVLGTTTLAILRLRLRQGLPGGRDIALFESGACYWHMVDLIWLILFPLFYLVN